jgi:hypothetical protein
MKAAGYLPTHPREGDVGSHVEAHIAAVRSGATLVATPQAEQVGYALTFIRQQFDGFFAPL